jgi:hypothetical protein
MAQKGNVLGILNGNIFNPLLFPDGGSCFITALAETNRRICLRSGHAIVPVRRARRSRCCSWATPLDIPLLYYVPA